MYRQVPHEMCVLELNTIEIVPTKHDVEMKTSTLLQ